ncbi:MAG: hypothetical protein HS116_11415 [Planctomycetes bacterium]|nr:hypothetical protein [Planctomycetota bacterium]
MSRFHLTTLLYLSFLAGGMLGANLMKGYTEVQNSYLTSTWGWPLAYQLQTSEGIAFDPPKRRLIYIPLNILACGVTLAFIGLSVENRILRVRTLPIFWILIGGLIAVLLALNILWDRECTTAGIGGVYRARGFPFVYTYLDKMGLPAKAVHVPASLVSNVVFAGVIIEAFLWLGVLIKRHDRT